MFRDALWEEGEGVAVQVRPLLSFILLWEALQCLIQQEETEGQSPGLLSSCLCDRRLSVLLYYLFVKHTTISSSLRWKRENHSDVWKDIYIIQTYKSMGGAKGQQALVT